MRKLLAIWAERLASVAGRLLGKQSSSAPGMLALKLYPNLIRDLSKELRRGIIVVCGTNGKTTTNNLLNTALQQGGFRTVCNGTGANMIGGVATAFADACSLTGKLDADWAVLEIDEASARRVFAHLKPDYMVITNLFRDQLDRYGEIETTMALLKEAIDMAEGVKLILNGDDPLTAQFGEGKDAVYFGISEQVLPQEETKEGQLCVKCGKEQSYHYLHYSQLGDYFCPHCGYQRPAIDFPATQVDLSASMKFSVNGNSIDVNYRGFYNIYNILAVYATLETAGVSLTHFVKVLEEYKPQTGRMEQMDLGKPFILNLAKNPAGFNQAIQTVMLDHRKKDIIIAINDLVNDGQDVSWIWDVDFEKLKDENLNTLSVGGLRLYDLALRFRYGGIPVDMVANNLRDALEMCRTTDAEVCYVLANYTAVYPAKATMLEMQKKLGKGGEEV